MPNVRERLFAAKDEGYRSFEAKIVTNIGSENIIGVRAPYLKKLAKELVASGEAQGFLSDLPHLYLEENNLHAYIINSMDDFNSALEKTELFLPYVDNWSTCDVLTPKAFRKDKDILLERIDTWLGSGKTYTVRFAIGCLMRYFLDEDPVFVLERVCRIRSDEYYVNMMCAWCVATAMAKNFDVAVKVLERHELPTRTHNKAISKGVDSFRLKAEQKEYIKQLKICE